MSDPFWKSARILLDYKPLIAVSLVGAVIAAASFGAGLSMILPVLTLLLESDQSLGDVVQERLGGPDRGELANAVASWAGSWLPDGQMEGFLLVMGVILVLSIVGSVGTFIRELMAITVALRATMAWRRRMFRRLVHAPISFMLTHYGGDHVSRMLVDTRIMAKGYTLLLGRTIGELLGGAAALTVAFVLNWQLSLLAMVGLPLIAVLLRKFGKIIRRATRKVLWQQGKMVSALNETLGGMRVVKVHNAEGYERRRFSEINRTMYREEMRARTVRAITSPLLKTISHVGITALAVLAAWLTMRRGVEPAELGTVLAALAGAAASVKPLSNLNNQLHESSAAAKRVLELMDSPVEPSAAADHGKPSLPRHRERIAFEEISFCYPGSDEEALHDVSLEVEHGETVAIVGGNGSGKTTLLSLLPRLLEPHRGRVLIDGVDIAGVRLRSLRRQIGVVSQETVLFHGTIADNIAYGRRWVPRERIETAARAAYAHDFIAALPKGYDTALGDGGSGLSGGQRQRLCIARALLRDPAIMILDEATSQIDTESEAKINQALRDLRHDRTTFVIAHRLSTVINADRIVVMDGGRVVDQGRHDELLHRCREYRLLTHAQLPSTVQPA